MFDPNSTPHRCRNSRCKTWLKEPVGNSRNAFCCAGCEAGFYRVHCRVCERPFKAKNSRKELCGRDKCANEFLRNKARFCSVWYPNPTLTAKPEKSPTKSIVKTGIKSDRAWSQIVGPDAPAINYRIPLDSNYAKRLARKENAHWQLVALIQRSDAPVNVVGGYRFPSAKAVFDDLSPPPPKTTILPATKAEADELITTIPADLSIPPFLCRGAK